MGSQEPCIYRVPSQLRDVKPEAYKPRMLLIGPLHHSAKPKAHKGNADSRYLEYGMMEDHKRMYRAEFTKRPDAIAIIEQMTKTIKREEYNIRASYAVSTAWILPYIFVELILNDSIFIAEFILRLYENRGKIGDLIVDNDFYTSTVLDDLKLLENQIPYFCLKELLNPILEKYFGPESQNLDEVFLRLFSVDKVITEPITFNHFTDMFRCVYVKSLGGNQAEQLGGNQAEQLEQPDGNQAEQLEQPDGNQAEQLEQPDGNRLVVIKLNNLNDPILVMKNADKLSSVGVEFKGVELPYSLNVTYKEGCLTIPSFQADEASNVIVRNIIAYEQCHDPERAFTTNYICFMNYLITSDKDVDILATSEVLTNGVGGSSMVLKTMNNLCTGVQISPQTQYQDIIKILDTHYKSRIANSDEQFRRKRRWTRLRKVYFSDTWTTTATLAAIFLLLVTLLGTVAAVFQATGVKMTV